MSTPATDPMRAALRDAAAGDPEAARRFRQMRADRDRAARALREHGQRHARAMIRRTTPTTTEGHPLINVSEPHTSAAPDITTDAEWKFWHTRW